MPSDKRARGKLPKKRKFYGNRYTKGNTSNSKKRCDDDSTASANVERVLPSSTDHATPTRSEFELSNCYKPFESRQPAVNMLTHQVEPASPTGDVMSSGAAQCECTSDTHSSPDVSPINTLTNPPTVFQLRSLHQIFAERTARLFRTKYGSDLKDSPGIRELYAEYLRVEIEKSKVETEKSKVEIEKSKLEIERNKVEVRVLALKEMKLKKELGVD